MIDATTFSFQRAVYGHAKLLLFLLGEAQPLNEVHRDPQTCTYLIRLSAMRWVYRPPLLAL